MDPPEEPDGYGGDDECITVKQCRRFCGHITAEVLQQELFFFGKAFLFLFRCHFTGFNELKSVKSFVHFSFEQLLALLKE